MDLVKRLIVTAALLLVSHVAIAFGEVAGEVKPVAVLNCIVAGEPQTVRSSTVDGAGMACVGLMNSAAPEVPFMWMGCLAVVKEIRTLSGVQQNTPTQYAVSYSMSRQLVRYSNPPPPASPCQPTGTPPGQVGGGGGTVFLEPQFMCPDGASPLVPGSTICQCGLGLKAVSGPGGRSCQVYSCPPSGTHAGVQPDIKVQQAGQSICRAGCLDTPSKWKVGPDDAIWAVSPYRSTGEFCGGAKDDRHVDTGDDKIEPPPVACGDGLCPGTVNGSSVCVACKKETTPGPSEAASGVTPGKDPDGTIKKSDKETSCSGTTCTTTTTHKDGAGNVVGTETKTEPKESFCQQNPGLSICKEGSFGGSCGGSFNCQGDAVQCAIAREIHTRGCQLYDTPNAFATIGESVMNSQAVPAGHPGGAPGEQDVSNMFRPSTAVGACLVDKTVVVGGRSLVLPFSQLCDPLRWLGYIAYAFSLIHAVSILLRKI